ncbi:Glucose/arabinose dehydrogenase, beta-propeller fold [Paramicrobacterium humi]|uniref:Glucose/arabinose dehydrogenase, beta-propeller fold n=2 Tax=Paramicrobacterium humi TaxID=640635 RepID=A0A1H4J5A0_9MICO|nr:Glucose/arabinose dehydrogenase, beta-propeller fold [Microbacterium humi]
MLPAVALAASVALMLAACAPGTAQPTRTPPPTTPAPAGSQPVMPSGDTETIATHLQAPWSIVPLGGGAILSFRDSGQIGVMDAAGDVRMIGTVAGVSHGGEGGLLGLALLENDDASWLYAYFTSESDNRIVRYALDGMPESLSLGERENILTGIPKAQIHNGGRLAFGPDGMLYATTGDATGGDVAQDEGSLAGKILRLAPDGGIPDDNPFEDSPVYSMGHRNPQGLAWTSDGRMWASEFGQNTWDELNLITPGGNYGWPTVEGIANDDRFIDPVYQWGTSDASPSGLTVIDDTLFMAGLGGQRLWVMLDGVHVPEGSHGLEGAVTASEYFTHEFGRLRDVAPAPDGSLYVLTNNTDGRGNPGPDDDRLIKVQLIPMVEG